MMTDQNTETYSKLLSTIIGLLEDDAEKTRIITCQILENLLTQFGAFIIPQVLIKILSSMTKSSQTFWVRLSLFVVVQSAVVKALVI